MRRRGRQGSALIVALWVILLITLLISSFAFDMHVEADITSYYRKRNKAHYIAQAGMELAESLLRRLSQVDEEALGADDEQEQLLIAAQNLRRGVGVQRLSRSIGEGTLSLDIVPEEGRRNINALSREDYADWEEILDQANIPEDRWPELIDCFNDWVDEDDLKRLSGAESDDPYYEQLGYVPKNGPLNTLDELMMIKGFDAEVLYGSPPGTPAEEAIRGIAPWLTVWSHGKVNVNTASREVLLTLPEIDEWAVDAILTERAGLDGVMGTRDDGFDSVDHAVGLTGMNPALRDLITVTDVQFLRITSVGEVGGVRSSIWAVMRMEGEQLTPIYWREEPM